MVYGPLSMVFRIIVFVFFFNQLLVMKRLGDFLTFSPLSFFSPEQIRSGRSLCSEMKFNTKFNNEYFWKEPRPLSKVTIS